MKGVRKDVELSAGAGEPTERDPALQEAASGLILQLCALDQALRLYSLDNSFVRRVLDELLQAVSKIQRSTGGAVTMTMVGYSVFLNRRLVRLGFNQYRKALQLQRVWEAMGIDEMAFDTELTEAGILEFAGAYSRAIQDAAALPSLLAQPWGGVTIRKVMVDDTAGEHHDPYDYTLRVYCALVTLTRALIRQVQAGQPLPLLRLKRTLQVLVDQLESRRGMLLALTGSPMLKMELATHLVNTAIHVMLLGQRAGLNRPMLMSLATAALLHDLPKGGLKEGTLNSLEHPSSIPAEERPRVDLHWLSTLQRVVHLGGFSDEMLARLVVLYESQLEFSRGDLYTHAGDLSGGGHSFFSQIISMCNLFDTLTWARQGKETVTPHRAMVALLSQAGAQFEPSLVSLFLEIVGLYPTGSVVLLSSNEIGLVTLPNPEKMESPMVHLVVDAQGQPVDGPRVDLSRDPSRQVLWPLKAGPLQINPVAGFQAEDQY